MSEKILAKVGNFTITDDDVTAFIAKLGPRGASYNTPEGRRAVLNQLINNKLLLIDAQRNLYEAEPAFRQELAQLKDELLIQYATSKVLGTVRVSEEEIRKYYDENTEKFNTGATVNASHILVSTEDEALDVLKSIKAGEISFEDAAKKYSSCPSKEAGGSLGDFGKGQMVPEFDAAVFAMEVGEITEAPVQTQFGYHLIKLNSKNEGGPIAYETIHDDLAAMLEGEKQNKAYTSKINQLKIAYPVDTYTI